MDKQTSEATVVGQEAERSLSDRIDDLLGKMIETINKVNDKTVANTRKLEQVEERTSRLESREEAFERRLDYIETYFIGPRDTAHPNVVLTPPYSSAADTDDEDPSNGSGEDRRRRQELQHFTKQDLEKVPGTNKLRCPLCQKALSPGYVLKHANLGKCQRR